MNIRRFSERTKRCIELSGGFGLAVLIMLLFWVGAFQRLEFLADDWRFRFRGERKPLEDILIITIDEQSEERLKQRTPWKRSIHAEMIRTLMQHQPKLIVYDLFFQTATDAEEDRALADALYDAYHEEREMGVVVLGQYISERLERPLELFAENAAGVGLMNLVKDADTVLRRLPAYTLTPLENGLQYNLTLSLEAATLYKGGVNNIQVDGQTLVFSRVEDGTTREVLRVLAPQGQLAVNFIGGRYAFPMLPFWKIIQGDYDPEALREKVIFIGDTSLTAHDYFRTPFSKPSRRFLDSLAGDILRGGNLTDASTFGIEIHAQAFQTILENSYLHNLPRWSSLLLILLVGTSSGILLFRERGFFLNLLMLIACAGFLWGISQYLFSVRYLRIELVPLEAALLVNFVAGLGFQRAVALYNRNKVKGAFQQYVSTSVVDEMLKHPEKLHLGGERKCLTVLFSDIRGFTSISERMESPELVEFLNAYLTEMTEIVLRYDGTLDKYMGDAIMAIYGAPIPQQDHAYRACSSALDMINRLNALQAVWQAQGKPVINIGIGLNSGLMTVGNMGSEKRFDYTVMGDHVNLGSRLEGTNKEYGTNIILSEDTCRRIQDRFIVRELDLVRVKGKKEPVRIYELVGRTRRVDEQILRGIRKFEHGLSAYRAQDWQTAIDLFTDALKRYGNKDAPSALYLARCRQFQQTPPPESWDGVYVMTTK